MSSASLIGVSRLRMGSDGHGITTLVGFRGCPLRCKYCLNPQCFSASYHFREWTPEEVMRILLKDELYFITSGGGVSFGGGEPLLWPEFIIEIINLGAKMWHTTIETSLNVPFDSIEKLYPYIDEYIIDIKDMNPIIYESYTGKDNKFVLSNLSKMLKDGMEPKMKCRVPFIPGYNNSDDQEHSFAELIDIGVTRIEMFDYLKKENSYERKRKM